MKKKLSHIVLFILGLSFVLETSASAFGFTFDGTRLEEKLDIDSTEESIKCIDDFFVSKQQLNKTRLKSANEVIVSNYFLVERYFPSIKKTAYHDLCIFHESFLL